MSLLWLIASPFSLSPVSCWLSSYEELRQTIYSVLRRINGRSRPSGSSDLGLCDYFLIYSEFIVQVALYHLWPFAKLRCHVH